ncbi:hypothetical protein [Clostridium sp. KNHs214]|uniref:hypothetical protein n=1 Tax=Clostridium sp. KNHs214 TaxID=1540257 RepID=UPI000B0587EE|nr:hypothetical protein [Clostridium sp. KNHs214]
MDKKEVKISSEDIQVINGKVIIQSDKLASEVEGMNIVGDCINGEEGLNANSVTLTHS